MAGKEDLKLLGLPLSPFVISVRMALNIKGVSYEYVDEDPSNKSELLLKSNPVHKKVPVLIHNGKPICESLVILQYVDELFAGRSILPTDPYERATARFWAAYAGDKVQYKHASYPHARALFTSLFSTINRIHARSCSRRGTAW